MNYEETFKELLNYKYGLVIYKFAATITCNVRVIRLNILLALMNLSIFTMNTDNTIINYGSLVINILAILLGLNTYRYTKKSIKEFALDKEEEKLLKTLRYNLINQFDFFIKSAKNEVKRLLKKTIDTKNLVEVLENTTNSEINDNFKFKIFDYILDNELLKSKDVSMEDIKKIKSIMKNEKSSYIPEKYLESIMKEKKKEKIEAF